MSEGTTSDQGPTPPIIKPAAQKDERVDRLVTWALSGAAFLAFTVGGWFINSLQGTVEELTANVQKLTTQVTVLNVSAKQLSDHESRIRALEQAAWRNGGK